MKIPAWLCVKYKYNRSKGGKKSGECSGWHWYGATSPEWERACCILGSSLRKSGGGGGQVTEPCSALHTGGDTIMLLLKRNEREHHSTSSPAIPSPRSQLKLYQTGKPHTCSPTLYPAPLLHHNAFSMLMRSKCLQKIQRLKKYFFR